MSFTIDSTGLIFDNLYTYTDHRMEVTIICAWCNEIIKSGNNELVSHGICKECEADFLDKLEKAEETESVSTFPPS
jgi:hypothetical protein